MDNLLPLPKGMTREFAYHLTSQTTGDESAAWSYCTVLMTSRRSMYVYGSAPEFNNTLSYDNHPIESLVALLDWLGASHYEMCGSMPWADGSAIFFKAPRDVEG